MSTFVGGSSNESDEEFSSKATLSSLIPIEEMSMTKEIPAVNIRRFVGVPDMQKIIIALAKALQEGTTNAQYLAFECVTTDNLAKIDSSRSSLVRHAKMSLYADIDLLIVKVMPSGAHETAWALLSEDFRFKLQGMGVPRRDLVPIGSTRYQGSQSSKEPDAGYKPLPARSLVSDWPTIVFEVGLSESLSQLRTDAEWWLVNSGGQVMIALVISLKPAFSVIHIEKWEFDFAQRPMTRAVASNARQPPQVPTCVQAIDIDHNTVTGAPLILEFKKIFLRAPIPPESDVVFTAQDLTDWANLLWAANE